MSINDFYIIQTAKIELQKYKINVNFLSAFFLVQVKKMQIFMLFDGKIT